MQVAQSVDDLEMTVRRRGQRYLARIPQLGLYAAGDSLSAAIAALEAKKQSLVDELTTADALDDVKISPPAPVEQMRPLPALGLFAAKGLIVVALVLFAVAYSRYVVQSEIERWSAYKFGAAFWENVETDIIRNAAPSNEMSEARRQRLFDAIHIIVERWRPFVREGTRLFSDQDDTPAPKP